MTPSDPAAVAFLLDHRERRVLEPFFHTPISLSEAARAANMKLNTMHYRVKRFLSWGLVEQVGSEVRRGHRIKLYQTSADEFVIPFAATTADTLATLMAELTTQVTEQISRDLAATMQQAAGGWEIAVRAGQGEPSDLQFRPSEDAREGRPLADDGPTLLWQDTVLRLSKEDAKALQRELVALLARYEERGEDGAQYLLRLGVLELSEDFRE